MRPGAERTQMSDTAEPHVTPGDIALGFLRRLDADGAHHLFSLDPVSKETGGQTFPPCDHSLIPTWVNEREGRLNLYFTANEVASDVQKVKPSKADIVAIRALFVDVDPQDGKNLDDERARIADMMEKKAPLDFSVVLDSGGGYQALAILTEKRRLDATVLDWAETYGRGLGQPLGGDNTQNIDRVLRLPGTTNIPTPDKVAKGRIERVARVVQQSDKRVTVDEIEAKITPLQSPASRPDEDAAISDAINEVLHSGFDDVTEYTDLPADLRERFEADTARIEILRRLWRDGTIEHLNPSGSEYRFALAGILKRIGEYTAGEYGALAWVWSFSNLQQKYDRQGAARQLGREWGRAEPAVQCFDVAEWFQPIDPSDTALATVFDQIAKRDRAPDVEDGEDVYPVLRISDILARPNPVYLVKEFLPQEGVGILFGPSGSKKSFMAFDLAMSIVHEFKEWHGRRIKPAGDGSVIYIVGEGSSGLKPRIKAWLQARGVTFRDDKLFVIDMAINFKDSKNIDRLIRTAKSMSVRPSLIVVDTLSQSMAGADENSQADATLFMAACGRLRSAFGGVVIGVHHPPKSASDSMRGSAVFGDNSDFLLHMISERGTMEGKITVVKQKDGRENIAYPYRLIHHVLMDEPADEDGEIPSSLVFDHIGTDQIDKGKPDASAQGGPDQAPEVLKLMKADYDAGRGWLYANNVTDRTRRFRYIMARTFDIKADRAKEMVDGWVAEGIVTVETSPGQRAKVLVPQFVPVDPASVFDDVGVFG